MVDPTCGCQAGSAVGQIDGLCFTIDTQDMVQIDQTSFVRTDKIGWKLAADLRQGTVEFCGPMFHNHQYLVRNRGGGNIKDIIGAELNSLVSDFKGNGIFGFSRR